MICVFPEDGLTFVGRLFFRLFSVSQRYLYEFAVFRIFFVYFWIVINVEIPTFLNLFSIFRIVFYILRVKKVKGKGRCIYIYIRSGENRTKNTKTFLQALKSQCFFHIENIRTFIPKTRNS